MARYLIAFETDGDSDTLRVIADLQAKGFSPTVKVIEDVQPPVKSRKLPLKRPPVSKDESAEGPSRDERWAAFLALVGTDQKLAVLRIIKTAGDKGITSVQGATVVGEKPNWFTGVFNGGIQRNIVKAGFEIGDVVAMNQTSAGWVYSPGPELKARSLPTAP